MVKISLNGCLKTKAVNFSIHEAYQNTRYPSAWPVCFLWTGGSMDVWRFSMKDPNDVLRLTPSKQIRFPIPQKWNWLTTRTTVFWQYSSNLAIAKLLGNVFISQMSSVRSVTKISSHICYCWCWRLQLTHQSRSQIREENKQSNFKTLLLFLAIHESPPHFKRILCYESMTDHTNGFLNLYHLGLWFR